MRPQLLQLKTKLHPCCCWRHRCLEQQKLLMLWLLLLTCERPLACC
jgi:hypothetical protein